MTGLDLQNTLVREFISLFDGMQFQQYREKTTDQVILAPISIYAQALPMRESDAVAYAPYLIVKLETGEQDDFYNPENVSVTLGVGIYDDGEDNSGHVSVMNIIETIQQQFLSNHTVAGKYTMQMPFKWTLNEDDLWPNFFGAIETHWSVPYILPEDPLA